ncbi:EF-hand domain-containing protein [Streptomyces purpureus]|uniref:Calcium-binding protein n=1 Tax=Streptomyces purpureus TaxID=1951 RepID=A0A918GZ09_9ACTN|nr:EF-hand domain-containing protein [Streptomyces purpureus]GGT18023.1 calcium-binding protein [Streptomyces purpureus]
MTAALKQRKLQRHFELLDIDGNGFIEQSDLREFADRITEAAGAEGSPQSRALRTEADRLWQALQKTLDADGDQRVSRDEFISAADITQVMNEAVKLGKMSFDVIDSDQDGRISRQEWLRMDQKLGVAPADSEQGFQHLDMDGDGFVSKAEYAKGVEEFYRSDDPTAPGNWSFGKF